uniref:Integrase catalytic domain-containing protein n=1 Tax=Tanacetum cinerariifolium TaxID=118510 RepID=A0A6L2MMC9_TANCI|nr:hypothetical protein [Tanacetum cinerariifolium]
MNKLVKSNLVRGLPSKVFENNHTCVACKKGKQHRASCKSKPVSSVSQQFERLHMDLFGPTFVKSLNKKSYYLVVTYDYSRFSWVFFLATKDETSTILKTFITGKENKINNKVKIIRCANGTDFKNQDLNQLCGMKGIKREFSVVRTPQQNRAEAVNTACYVQNRVLVTKPHNKTPYELLLGRTPSLGFMRPFGCHVTIVNTLDPLGKFNRKADEGFLVGYSLNTKAFRVFNSRTRIVQETLYINFLKNQSNVAGSGSTWLFDIDTLTQSMHYQPVITGNQPNHNADPQNTDADVAFAVKENESEVHVSLSSRDKTKKHDEKTKREAKGKSHVNAASAPVTVVGPNLPNSTNNFNAASPSDNAVSLTFEIGGKSLFVDPSQYPDDPDMPALEDIVYSDDEEDVGAEADFFNLETSITVSPIPTTRVHKDHPVTQIISDLTLAPQTRKEPKRVHQALKDPGWIEAMQEELLQFKMQKEHTQEEGIDYEEVFAPVARIEAIRLFLAYASFMGFMVYQMDVKSAFLYETIEEQVYVCQPIGFKDPDYHDKVYKVVKALYGLHQAPRAWYETLANYLLENGFQRGKIDQTLFIKKKKVKKKDDGIFISQDKYVAKILRKFGLTDGKSANTPIDTEKPLLKDPDVKIIFTYLKGKPNLGLWYPNDSPFNLVAYSDSDYAEASLDRKSTTGGSCCKLLCSSTMDSKLVARLWFWAFISIKKSNDVVKLQALIDRKKVVIAKDSIRQDLRLDDADGVECLPTEEIFAELERMIYEKPPPKLTFYKAFFSAQ